MNNRKQDENSAFLPKNIIAKKQALGFDTGTHNVLIATETLPYIATIIFSVVAGDPKYQYSRALLSFEPNGVLIMGVDANLAKYTNKDEFIDAKQLHEFQIKNKFPNYALYMQTDTTKYWYKIPKFKNPDYDYDYNQESLKNIQDILYMYD